MKLQTGDLAPDFTTTASFLDVGSGKIKESSWTLITELKKSPVMLVFYPGDFTAVCTKQLCDYKNHWDELKRFSVQIVGVSTNDKSSHEKFLLKYRFPFPLLDDSSKKISRTYGMLGLIGMSARGLVLIIDEANSCLTHSTNGTIDIAPPSAEAVGQIRYVYREKLSIFHRSAHDIEKVLQSNLVI